MKYKLPVNEHGQENDGGQEHDEDAHRGNQPVVFVLCYTNIFQDLSLLLDDGVFLNVHSRVENLSKYKIILLAVEWR